MIYYEISKTYIQLKPKVGHLSDISWTLESTYSSIIIP